MHFMDLEMSGSLLFAARWIEQLDTGQWFNPFESFLWEGCHTISSIRALTPKCVTLSEAAESQDEHSPGRYLT